MYSQGFREAAMILYEYLKNMQKVAIALKIGVATVWRWKHQGIVPQKRHDTPRSKFTEAMLDFIKLKLDENNSLTLNDLKAEILLVFSIDVSRQCIANALKKLKITRKRMHTRGSCRKIKLIERHRDFIEKYNALKLQRKLVICLDETGYDQYTLPIFGRSNIGTKAICTSHPTRRNRLSVIMAIDRHCNHYYEFVTGTTNSKRFEDFIKKLQWPKGTTIIMDNASIHKTKLITKALTEKGYTSLFIPPYTPECNPIENVFSSMKHHYRKDAMDYSKNPENLLKTIIDTKLDKTMYDRCYINMETYIKDYEKKYKDSPMYQGILKFFPRS